MLSPDESCGRAFFGRQAFSSTADLSKCWQDITGKAPEGGSSAAAAAGLPQMPELDFGQPTGLALLEGLCARLEPSAADNAGMASYSAASYAVAPDRRK